MLINDRCSQLRAFEFVNLFFSFFFTFIFPQTLTKNLKRIFQSDVLQKRAYSTYFLLTIRGVCPYPPLLQRNMLYHAFPSFFGIKPAQGCLRIQVYSFQFVHEANSQVDCHVKFNLALYPAMF